MGLTKNLGTLAQGVFSDSSLNIGIGGAPSGSFKFEVTGTGKFSGALSGTSATFSSGIISTAPSSAIGLELRARSADEFSQMNFTNNAGSNQNGSIGVEKVGTNGGLMYFYTKPDGGTIAERMRITSGGNVLIGDSANTIGNTRFYVKGDGTNPASRIWANTSTSTVYGLVVRHENTSDGAYIQFLTDGNVETGRIFDSSGTMQYATSSDLRLKTNIKPLKNALNSVLALNPCTYDMFRGENTTIESAGLIAQEVYEIYPYVVGVGGDSEKTNPWSVDYGKLTPLLISAIQELNAKITQLENK